MFFRFRVGCQGILSISPLAGFQLDYIASFLSIASPDIIARVILTQVLAVNTTVVLATYFLFWLCQRFATPRFSSCAMDYVQTALILCPFFLAVYVPLQGIFRAQNSGLEATVAATGLSLAIFIAILTGLKGPCCTRISRRS